MAPNLSEIPTKLGTITNTYARNARKLQDEVAQIRALEIIRQNENLYDSPGRTGAAAWVSWPTYWSLNGQSTIFRASCLFWTTGGHFLHLSKPPVSFRRSLAIIPSAQVLMSKCSNLLTYSYFMLLHIKETGWEGMEWINLAQDKDKWQGIINLQVPQNLGNFLTWINYSTTPLPDWLTNKLRPLQS